MNFPGPINSNLSTASAVSLDGEQFGFPSKPHAGDGHAKANGIIVPDKQLLFHGDYVRDGNDLVLSSHDQKYVIHDYFRGEKRPALISNDGAMLSGQIVSSLTGYVQYAQAAPADPAAQVVGHVMKLTGSASVIRNGVTVELNIGDAVQKGDVIQTGSDSSIAMTLIDGTAFGMQANARMVLNELVYDPNGSSNSSFISLVQGTITFVAGQTAKNGNMRVETPVATMGIRGTAVLVKIISETGNVETSLGVEPDGHVGGLVFYDNATGALIGTMTQAGRVTVFSPSGVGQPVTATEYLKSLDQNQADKGLFSQVFQLYFPNYNPDANPKSTDHPRTDIGVPPTIIGKAGIDPDTGRPTITYTIQTTNPDTHVTTDLKIIYVNTPPQFTVTDATDVQATVLGPHSFKLGDHVTIVDPDIGTAPFFDVAVPYLPNSGSLTQATTSSPAPNSYLLNSSLVSLDPVTGVVTYNPEGFRFLGDGETAVYTFKFVAASGVGPTLSDTGNETLTLTVTGENDAPVFAAADTPLSFSENAQGDSTAHVVASIPVAFTDEDFSDTAGVFSVSTSVATAHTSVQPTADLSKLPSMATLLTYLTFDNSVGNSFGVTRVPLTDQGTVNAKFTAPDGVFDFLAQGEQIQIVYTITIDDGHAGSTPSTETITFTVTGTNDAPILATDTSLTPHIADEAFDTSNAPPTVVDTANGSLAFTDVDLTDTHQASAALNASPTSVVWSGGLRGDIPQATLDALATAMTAAIATGVVSGTPGVTDPDSTNTGAGSLDWTFSLPDHLSDFLAHGETLTVVYDITVADYHNGTPTGTSSTQQVTVQIVAANDQPNITVIDTSATVQEDAGVQPGNLLQDTGSVTFTDADVTDTHTVNIVYNNDAVGAHGGTVSTDLANALATALSGPASALAEGVNTFDWNFSLDNSLVQYLGVGETVTATYTIDVKDNSGVLSSNTSPPQTVTVTITGTNDAPVLTANAVLPSAAEDSGGTAQTLSSLFAGSVQDADQTAYLKGFAISDSGVSTDGAWWFSDNGGVWSQIGTTSASAALIVSASVLVKFVPNTDFNGDPPSLTVYAIDDTYTGFFSSGSGGTRYTVDLTQAYTHGDTAPISQNGATISTTITAVNDAPVATGSATLASIYEDAPNPAGDTVGNLFAVNFSDAKDSVPGGSTADTFAGIAVTGYSPDSAKGDWQYSTDGGANWNTIAAADYSSALTLSASDILRFVPAADYNGAATTLNANLIETGEIISSGATIVLSAVGGTTHFSQDQVALGETINPVNDAPDFSGSAFGQPFVENGTPVQLVATGGFVVHDIDNSNFANGSLTVSIGATGSHAGDALSIASTDHIQVVGTDVQFDADGTGGGPNFVSIGTLTDNGTSLSISLNSLADVPAIMELSQAIRFSSTSDDPTSDQRTVTFTLNDGGGTANGGHDTTSFDVAVNVTPINDAPVLDLNSTDTPDVSTSYTAPLFNDGNPFPIALAPTVSDVDNTTMSSATIVLTDGQSGDFFFIPGETSPGTGTLEGGSITWTISGVAGTANPLTVTFTGSSTDYADAIQQISFGSNGGSAGDRHIDVTVNDGTDNSNTAVATITVNDAVPSNHAPTLTDFALPILTNPPAYPDGIYSLVGSNYSDADFDGLNGLAISSVTADPTTQGVWQYFDGSTWHDILPADVSPTHALALNYAEGLQFVPVSGYAEGSASITAYALDSNLGQSSGSPTPVYIDVTAHGGSTHISDPATITAGAVVVPVANDDAIAISAVSNLYATSGSLTGNDTDANDTFAISRGSYGAFSDTPDSEGIIRLAGAFGTLLLFSTDHAASTTLGSLSVPGGYAGDYVFVIGYDVNGNPIADNPIARLLPGDAPLTDQFQYVVTDNHGHDSNTANINVTYDLNPIVETVQTGAGYDATTLWSDLKNGLLGTYDANHLTLVNGNHTVTVDTTGLTWNAISGGIELTGGVVNAFHVTDSTTNDPLLDLTNVNMSAVSLYAAAGPSGTQSYFDGLIDTRSFDIHGGAGVDVLTGYNFNDRIDTGGGADAVNAGDGNDVIVVHDNSAWQIDGGAGVNTLKVDGTFDMINGPATQSLSNVQIIDLDNGDANVIAVEGQGVYEVNSDHTIRILGDSNDRVALVNNFTGHANGHWGLENVSTTYTGDNITNGVTFTEYAFKDAGVTYATAFVQNTVEVNVGVLNGDQITTSEAMDGSTTVFDAFLNDSNQSAQYKLTAVAQHGTVATSLGVALDDNAHQVVESVAAINSDFAGGIVYTPHNPLDAPDGNGELYDTVTLTVRDTTNLVQDTMNFVFRQQGTGSATLVGTNEKDVIFGTENSDTMSGLGGKDNFVFTNTVAGSGNDTITDFHSGNDHIVINDFGDLFNGDASAWFNANVTDGLTGALVHIDANSSVTLTGVTKANLTVNDFIVHPGTVI